MCLARDMFAGKESIYFGAVDMGEQRIVQRIYANMCVGQIFWYDTNWMLSSPLCSSD